MKTATASLAVMFCLLTAHTASAQIGFRIGNVGVVVQSSSRGNSFGRNSRRSNTFGGYAPQGTGRVYYQSTSNPPVYQNPSPAYESNSPTNRPAKGPWFMGRWTLSSNDYRSGNYNGATLMLGANGYTLVSTLGQRENGDWMRRFSNSGDTFRFSLRSPLRGETTFRGRWIVPQQQFVLIGESTGVRYTLTRS